VRLETAQALVHRSQVARQQRQDSERVRHLAKQRRLAAAASLKHLERRSHRTATHRHEGGEPFATTASPQEGCVEGRHT
jgi:hypothetical protein